VGEQRRTISIRHPYAWAVIYRGKDVKNRGPSARRQFKPAVGERVLIHASLGMTAAEYENAAAFMASIGARCLPHVLSRAQRMAMSRRLPK
jgi:hypothetical protein